MPAGKSKRGSRPFAARQLANAEIGLAESPENVDVRRRRRLRSPAIRQQRIAFGKLCDAARRERIDLGARGFYATPGVDFNRETGRGNPFFYYTQGAAVAEVEIDRFTGELRVPRVDLLIDIGRSINPGVDRGQVIGGFIQGMGWVTAECLVYNDRRANCSPIRRRRTRFPPSPTCRRCSIASSSRTTTTSRTSPAARPSASRR